MLRMGWILPMQETQWQLNGSKAALTKQIRFLSMGSSENIKHYAALRLKLAAISSSRNTLKCFIKYSTSLQVHFPILIILLLQCILDFNLQISLRVYVWMFAMVIQMWQDKKRKLLNGFASAKKNYRNLVLFCVWMFGRAK